MLVAKRPAAEILTSPVTSVSRGGRKDQRLSSKGRCATTPMDGSPYLLSMRNNLALRKRKKSRGSGSFWIRQRYLIGTSSIGRNLVQKGSTDCSDCSRLSRQLLFLPNFCAVIRNVDGAPRADQQERRLENQAPINAGQNFLQKGFS
jgi:hypothetical protein